MFQMTDDSDPRTIRVLFKDKKGKPAKVDGPPQWTVSNPDTVTLVVALDGMSCTVAPSDAGTLGTCQLNLTADADLGTGVKTITGSLDIEVVGGQADTAELVPDAAP